MALLDGASAASKRTAVIYLFIGMAGLSGVGWASYKIWKLIQIQRNKIPIEVQGEVTPQTQVSQLMGKTETNEQHIEIQYLKGQIKRMEEERKNLDERNEALTREVETLNASKARPAKSSLPLPPPPSAGNGQSVAVAAPPPDMPLPPPPPPGAEGGGMMRRFMPTAPGYAAQKAPESHIFGGSFGPLEAAPVKLEEPKKVKKPAIKIPSNSFGVAFIFAGGMAPTVLEGEAKGVRLLMRIATPTQLPNRVKSNLIGCFLQGAATGNLQSERADIVLTKISCIDRKQRGVIDQEIKGWVTGEDGVAGIQGAMVSELEKTLGRAFVAGMFKTTATTLQAQSMTLSTFGTSNPDPGKAVQNSVAGGFGEASNLVAQLYMKLAQLQMPVVAIGTGLKVGYVISDGVELAINNYCDEDDIEERELGCEEKSASLE